MTRIAVVVGSTRPGRRSMQVAEWVLKRAREHGGAEFGILDVADFDLPLLDEPLPPSLGNYQRDHTKRWAAAVAGFDGFIFVTAEYNHSVPGALKNALDYIYAEWNNKAAAFVSYGSAGGVRAVENLRLIAAELQMADVRAQVALPIASDFRDYTTFTPSDAAEQALQPLFEQLISWSTALQTLRK
ncbi:NADPH-dependent FMN reductase [Pseudarthrobacter phenanthrenivorans]|jgi:NAD(P)H-dependent FMN reductase|uniref:NADPH-dependent FMN reductase n=1 Tax=Pseudarthrobacter phenanthrenivorans TaxID=361575 RepID=A0A0B4ETT1_PSEPS|nr:NAD(P)H-dependent oxidoreductase [Pseudarthrobacter phenanthrenivorans]KIC70113.1 NADPH-dependent FMN reductase [Pseudarthrobacter phenanthrenivorans]